MLSKIFSVVSNYCVAISYLSRRQISYRILKILPFAVCKKPGKAGEALFAPKRPEAMFVSRWRGRNINFLCGSFEFLNCSHDFGGEIDWECMQFGGLWLDHLHYLRYLELLGDDLSPEIMNKWCHYLADWYAKTDYKSKAFNPPYNASERIFVLGRFLCLSANKLQMEELGLHIQVVMRDLTYVAHNLEFHLGGNHLLKNLLSLLFGSLLFEEGDVADWNVLLAKYLPQELNKQILSDGMHYELSPMYHNLVLVDLMDILSVMPHNHIWYKRIAEYSKRMLSVTKSLRHPDGQIPLFNDASFDLGVDEDALISAGEALFGHCPVVDALPEAGYYFKCSADSSLFVDAGNIGPDEQPGHAHADNLTFELSICERRFIVDSGTSYYGDNKLRFHQRSTIAHNTIEIDAINSSKIWGAFRVARRARGQVIAVNNSDLVWKVEAMHNGYKCLMGSPTHNRCWQLSQGLLLITDTIYGKYEHSLVSSLHFAPEFIVEKMRGNNYKLSSEDELLIVGMRIWSDSDITIEAASSNYYPEFGVEIPNTKVMVSFCGDLPVKIYTEFTWSE